MGRVDKEFEARMQGMIYAYNLAKEGGLEALDADMKKRNITKAPMKFSTKQMDEFYKYVADNIYTNVFTVACYTLYDNFGYGKEQLTEFKRLFDKNVGYTVNLDYMGEHYVRLEDYAVELNEKFNLGIDANIVAMSQDSYDEVDFRYKRCKVETVISELRDNGFFEAAEFLEKKMM